MKERLSWPVFWALVGVFIVIVFIIFIPPFRDSLTASEAFLIPLAVFSLLGVALIVLTLREKIGGGLKTFFLLAGASAAGFFVSVLLHAAADALFIYFFGEDFWDRIGIGNEPLFFSIAIFVCPLGFLAGVVGSIVLRARKTAPSPR